MTGSRNAFSTASSRRASGCPSRHSRPSSGYRSSRPWRRSGGCPARPGRDHPAGRIPRAGLQRHGRQRLLCHLWRHGRSGRRRRRPALPRRLGRPVRRCQRGDQAAHLSLMTCGTSRQARPAQEAVSIRPLVGGLREQRLGLQPSAIMSHYRHGSYVTPGGMSGLWADVTEEATIPVASGWVGDPAATCPGSRICATRRFSGHRASGSHCSGVVAEEGPDTWDRLSSALSAAAEGLRAVRQ